MDNFFPDDSFFSDDSFFLSDSFFPDDHILGTYMIDNYTPTELLECINQELDYEYCDITITGEVASFATSHDKWVFFDLKDEKSSVPCFMTLWNLRTPLEDGMKIIAKGTPTIKSWGKFSFTVQSIQLVGEGSLKKAYEKLKKKLTNEGLFDPAKKRPLPEDLTRLGVISSTGAAGYADFIKIISARWGGIKVTVANTQVQGIDAPDQIIRALRYFNERSEVQVIAILRGGGSADDLACFNDEKLVREIAGSRIPIVTGIGHEIDETLTDLAADVRASTPSNAAEMLTRDRREAKTKLARTINGTKQVLLQEIARTREANRTNVTNVSFRLLHELVEPARTHSRQAITHVAQGLLTKYIEPMRAANQTKMIQVSHKIQGENTNLRNLFAQKLRLLEALNPEKVLSQGYAIIAGKISPGETIHITTAKQIAEAEIKKVTERS